MLLVVLLVVWFGSVAFHVWERGKEEDERKIYVGESAARVKLGDTCVCLCLCPALCFAWKVRSRILQHNPLFGECDTDSASEVNSRPAKHCLKMEVYF